MTTQKTSSSGPRPDSNAARGGKTDATADKKAGQKTPSVNEADRLNSTTQRKTPPERGNSKAR